MAKSSLQHPCIPLLWLRTKSHSLTRVSANLLREIGSYLALSVLLPGVSKGRLYVVNVLSKQYKSVPFPGENHNYTHFYQINPEKAMYTRLIEGVYRAYSIDLTTLISTELPGHLHSSSPPSVCYVPDSAYLFRFHISSNTGSEKYSFPIKTWAPLSHVSIPHHIFSLWKR